MRAALDTDVLAYAHGFDDTGKTAAARALLDRLSAPRELILPAQVLAELTRVLLRKFRLPADEVRRVVLAWRDEVEVAPTTAVTVAMAIDLVTDHKFQPFDAIILAASAEARCRILVSEDVQDGFTWGGVTVVNPFTATQHPLLAAL